MIGTRTAVGDVYRNDTTYFFWSSNEQGKPAEGALLGAAKLDASDEELGRLAVQVLDDAHDAEGGDPYFKALGYRNHTAVWQDTIMISFVAVDPADRRTVSFQPSYRTKRLARDYFETEEDEKASIDDLAACGRALRKAFERAT